MTPMDNMADIHDPSAGSWYQPIHITTRVAPRVYTTRQVRSMGGLGEITTNQLVVFGVGIALLAGIWYVAKDSF